MQLAIVCVDDEWAILRSLGEQLKRHFGKRYVIELANGGADALSLCAELVEKGTDIALIISDQQMLGMGGDALLIQLHMLYPRALKIMLTGQADADSVGNVVNRAALYRYIRKPWDETDLVLTAREALRYFQQEQQLVEQNELLKQTNAKLKSSLSLLLATLEATADGILVLDSTGKVISFNQKFVNLWQLSDLDVNCHDNRALEAILERLAEPDALSFSALLAQVDSPQHHFLSLKNGSIIEYYLQPYQLEGQTVGHVWSFRDVTQEKQTEALMKHQALHDVLTNLPNRTLFQQKFMEALQDKSSCSKLVAVMFLDLDQFKEINDSFGHAMGDLLLQCVAHRLVGCLREIDLLARWGGDEFVLLLPQIRGWEEIGKIAQRLLAALHPEFSLEGYSVCTTASIGIAVYPHDGLVSQTLLHHADAALYSAKRNGRNNYQFYTHTLSGRDKNTSLP